MIIDWIRKLLRRPNRSGQAPLPRPERWVGPERRRGPQRAGGAGSRREDRADVLDLRRIAVYAPSDREPLHPRDGRRLGGLQAQVRAWLRENTRAAVPLPELAQRLIQRGAAPSHKDINGLVQLLHQEPVLTAQILRAANAAEYAGLGEVHGIREAVMRLGSETAWQLALVLAVRTVMDREATALHQRFREAWQEQWSHATTAAATAGWLAMTYSVGDVQRCFLTALLHDIGKIFALQALSNLLREGVIEETIAPPLLAAVLEGVHVELGAELVAHWRLPSYVAAMCSAHHDDVPPAGDVEVHVVRVVSGLDEIRRNPFHRQGLVGQVLDSAAALELDAVRLRALLAELKQMTVRNGLWVGVRSRA